MTTPTTNPQAGLPQLQAELRAAFEKRLTTPTNQTVGTPLTPKQMQDWEENSLLAGGWTR